MKKGCFFLMIFALTGIVSGCGSNRENSKKDYQVTIADYQKNTYPVTSVQYGTIEPVLTLELTPDELESNSYSIWQEMLEVEAVNVEKGARVQAGEVMVSFKADEIKETIAEYEKRREEDQMLITHYTKLMELDKQEDYSADIKKLKNDLNVANLYIQEQTNRLSEYQLVAEKAGTVTAINEDLMKGYGTGGKALITVASGSSNYTTSTADDFAFQIGDIYEARCGVAVYEMKVFAVEEAGELQKITFEPVSDMAGVAENEVLTMEIPKEKIQNALYVEEAAIFVSEEKKYAFLIDENGFREAVPVTTGDTVDGYVIVKEGLKEGEQVTLN